MPVLKWLAAAILLFCNGSASAQLSSVILLDSVVSLSWDQFRLVDDKFVYEPYAAYICTPVNYSIQVVDGDTGKVLSIRSLVEVDKTRSWIRQSFWQNSKEEQKNWALAHEKGHLINAWIMNEHFRNSIRETHFYGNTMACMDSLYNTTIKTLNIRNEAYDKETSHGSDVQQQSKWDSTLLHEALALGIKMDAVYSGFELKIPAPMIFNKKKDPLKYNYQDNFRMVFNESFDTPPVDTASENGSLAIKSEDGFWDINTAKRWTYNFGADIDFNADFEMECSFELVKHAKKMGGAVGLMWATGDSSGRHDYIVIMSSGVMKYVRCFGGDHSKDEHKTIFSRLHKEEANKVTIRKVEDKYYIFVNDVFEKSLDYSSMNGRRFGIGVFEDCEVKFDELRIFSLSQ